MAAVRLPLIWERRLEAVSTGFASLPTWFVLGGHCVTMALWFKGRYGDRYLLNSCLAFAMAFGGGLTSAMWLQRPDSAPLPMMGDDTLPLYWVASWWAVNFFPGNLVEKVVGTRVGRALASVGLSGLRAGIVAQRIDLARKLYPGTLFGPVLLGTLGSSGGTLVVDAVEVAAGYSNGPSELSAPGFSLWSGFLPSISHLLVVHVFSLTSSSAHLGFWIAFYTVHTAFGMLFPSLNWDYTKPPRDLFHLLTNIPQPKKILTDAEKASLGIPKAGAARPKSAAASGAAGVEGAGSAEGAATSASPATPAKPSTTLADRSRPKTPSSRGKSKKGGK